MGCIAIQGAPCAKGPVLHWLDCLSVSEGARERLTALLNAIKALGPSYQGLENAVDTYLAAPLDTSADLRRGVLEHLRDHWFNDNPAALFPGQDMRVKWAEAVIKTLELSLAGRPHPIPINSWWIIISTDRTVQMMNLANVNSSGVTVSSSVTLLIFTPLPPPSGAPSNRSLWGDAEAWVTHHQTGSVITRRLDKEVRRTP